MDVVVSARHRWPEAAGFTIHRPAGIDTYTLLHFFGPVWLDGTLTQPGACILYAPRTPQRFTSECALMHDWTN